MKLNAVGVSAKDLKKSVEFYEILGFKFSPFKDEDEHVEAVQEGGIKLMIDTDKMVKQLIGEAPKPGNHSNFAVQYDSSAEVDKVANGLKEKGFKIVTEPWDAFWGQRYCTVEDPSGYKVDLYATL